MNTLHVAYRILKSLETNKKAEYLHENSTMKKIGKVATNLITIVKP